MAVLDEKKTDRRVLRTRNAIRTAFTELLAETNYSKITITALAKRADVDRKTFYTHYSSVGSLLEDVVTIQTEESLKGMDFRDFFADPYLCTKRFLTAIEGSLPFTRDELRSAANNIPIDEFLRCWTSVAKKHIHHTVGPLPQVAEENMLLLLEFYLGGILNAYLCWLKSDSDTPSEYVIDLIADSVVCGLPGTLSKRAKDLQRQHRQQ